MLETKEQKQIFFGSLALILVLVSASLLTRNKPKEENQPVTINNQNLLNSKAYLDYFAAANVDQTASKELLQTILTENDIKQEIENELKVNQEIKQPQLDSSKIKISKTTSNQQITDYLTSSISEVYSFGNDTKSLNTDLLAQGSKNADLLKPELVALKEKLYNIEVPKDAENIHKALLSAYTAYGDLLDSATNFKGDYTSDENFWPNVYKNYVIANQNAEIYTEELNKIAGKYKISYIDIAPKYADSKDLRPLPLRIMVPEAKAFLSLSWSFTIGDIPRIIMDGVKEGLSSAFLQFMGSMLNKLVTKIEQSYAISNFLYYTDALVSGQYVNDYLKKYVNDPLDQQIVKRLIPQISCGKNPDLKQVFQSQAVKYLGYDPASLNVSDPDYYLKMARAGDFLASSNGWQAYYEGLAAQAQTEAQKSAEQELLSPGLKTPRSSIQSTITNSINSIISAERAALTATLQLGINNAESIISGLVARLTQTLINRFVFQGVVSTGGNIAVFKEQSTCIATPVMNPVLPLPDTKYEEPPAPATVQAAVAGQCKEFQDLTEDCSNAILGELEICANNISKHTGNVSCTDLSTSQYTNAMLQNCNSQIRKTPECLQLQEYLQKIK